MADEARASSEETESNASGSEQSDPGFLTGRWFKSNRGSRVGAKESFAPFFYAEKHTLASLLLLFRKMSRSRRLFACKRAHNAFGSLTTFCECALGTLIRGHQKVSLFFCFLVEGEHNCNGD